MSLLNSGESLVKFVANKVKGFEVRRIDAVSGIYVTDVNGYIGIKINDYFSQNGSPYPGNYALVARGPDYSSMGLGRVTFLEYESHVIGGKSYRCVTMPDGKVWMAENLDFMAEGITFKDGTSGNTWDMYSSTAQASYYSYDESTYGWEGKKYGLLYNWYAAAAITIGGWHLPTSDEWSSLFTACGGATEANLNKLHSTTDWTSGNGTDNWGFTVFPTGFFFNSFSSIGTDAYFWSNHKYIKCISGSASSSRSNDLNGYPIRLVKDPDPSEAGA